MHEETCTVCHRLCFSSPRLFFFYRAFLVESICRRWRPHLFICAHASLPVLSPNPYRRRLGSPQLKLCAPAGVVWKHLIVVHRTLKSEVLIWRALLKAVVSIQIDANVPIQVSWGAHRLSFKYGHFGAAAWDQACHCYVYCVCCVYANNFIITNI